MDPGEGLRSRSGRSPVASSAPAPEEEPDAPFASPGSSGLARDADSMEKGGKGGGKAVGGLFASMQSMAGLDAGSGLGSLGVVQDEKFTSVMDQSLRGYVAPERKATWFSAFVLLFSELVGTGILSLPFALSVLGWIPGVCLIIFFGALAMYSGLLLRRLALAFPYGVTYGNVAEAVAGPVMREIVFFTVYTYFFFVLAIYVLTAAETLQIAIYEYNVCLYYYTVATVAVLLPLAQLRSMHAIAYAGVLSSLAVFLAVGLCLADSLRGFEGVAPSVLKLGNSSFFNTFSAITSICFAYGGQGIYLEVMAEMKQPSQFDKSLYCTTATMIAFYVGTSVVFYFSFGSGVPGNVLYNMGDSSLKTIAGIAMFFHVLVGYVITSQVVNRALHTRLAPQTVGTGGKREALQWFGISTATMLGAWLVANAIPFFAQLLSLVAAMFMGLLAFGYPSLLYILACKKTGQRIGIPEWILLVFMLVLTAFLTGVGTYSNIKVLIDNFSEYGLPFSCQTGP